MNDPKMISKEEFSRRSGLDGETVIEKIRTGEIVGRLENREWLVAETGLEKFYVKPTIIDILFSIFAPPFALIYGVVVLIRGQTKRGQAMVGISILSYIIFAVIWSNT